MRTFEKISNWAISSQAPLLVKVQRLSREGVGLSNPKRHAPEMGEDIVYSLGKLKAELIFVLREFASAVESLDHRYVGQWD